MATLPKAVKYIKFFFSLSEVEEDKKDVLHVSSFSYQIFHPNSCSFPQPSKSFVRLAYLKSWFLFAIDSQINEGRDRMFAYHEFHE